MEILKIECPAFFCRHRDLYELYGGFGSVISETVLETFIPFSVHTDIIVGDAENMEMSVVSE